MRAIGMNTGVRGDGVRTEVGREELLACEDEHEQPDGEEEGRDEGEDGGVLRLECGRPAEDELHEHSAEAELG